MRKIAIIGAGQAGLLLGIGLVDAGYAVTLFSERTPEAILHESPIAFPILFDRALQIERQLGLNFWDEQFPGCQKIRNNMCDPEGNPALTLSYDLEQPWQGVDQRLKFFYWMQEFLARGGELVIQPMTLSYLEQCTQNYDLVVVAAGRGMLSNIFKRDAKRSTHDKPARRLAGGFFTGLQGDDLLTFKLTVFPEIGEIFQVPFYVKGTGYSHAVVFEAYPGGAMDLFASVQSGQELLEQSLKTVQQFMPWNYEVVKDMKLTDENAWLYGAITPTVRQPIAHLPSGSVVMGIGDTVILNDPIAGQGANNATKMAHFVTQRVIEHGQRNFDVQWMQAVFDEFWLDSQHVNRFCDCLLMPQAHHQDILAAAAHNPGVAKDYFNGVVHPPNLSPWFFDPEAAKEYLAQKNATEAATSIRNENVLAV